MTVKMCQFEKLPNNNNLRTLLTTKTTGMKMRPRSSRENALLDNEWIFKLKMEESNLLLELESWHFSSGFMRWDIAGPLKYSWLSSVQNKADQTDNENPIKVEHFLYWQYKFINIQYTYKIK